MVRRSLSSLRVKLVLLVLVALLPAFALILYNGLRERADQRREAEAEVSQLTQAFAGRQGQFVEGGRQFLASLAGLAGQTDVGGIAPASCGDALAALLEESPSYANIGIADANGQVFCSGLPSSGPVDASFRAWFVRARATKDFAVGDYQIGTITRKATVNFGYPLLGEDGQVTAVIFAALDLGWFNEFAVETELPEGAALTIIDRSGTILARHPEPEAWVGKTLADTPLVRAVLDRGEGIVQTSGVDGVDRVYAVTPLAEGPAPGAFVTMGVASSTVYADATRTLVFNLALLSAASLLALAAAWFGGGLAVLSPVRGLLRATERLRLGDLGARTGLPHDRGELGQLAQAFDEMATSLEARERERVHNAAALAAQARELKGQAEDLARSNADLEQFAYVASHDLQEPLRMVANYTQLLGRRYKRKLDPDADEFINYAVDGATRMQRLIEDLLAFSRVGTRGKELELVNCQDALERALVNLAAAVEEAGAVITHDPLPTVLGDDGQLSQLFQNLIGNAIRFRGQQPSRIHVSAVRAEAEWTLSVADNGIGVEPQYTDRIFVIFQRLHTRAEYPGTGIGLAICKKIVERHGGRIWVESNGQRGAIFRFTLRAAGVPAVDMKEETSELITSR